MRNTPIAVVKDLASSLIDLLKHQGIAIKRTGALEVISHLQNHTDWNRFRAKLAADTRPRQLETGSIDATVLLARPGFGKTEALKTILSLEASEGRSQSLYICLAGSALWYELGKDPFLPKNINYWKVLCTPEGLLDVIKPDRLVDGPHIVDMSDQRRWPYEGLVDAFASFMTLYQSDLSSGRIGSILIDEFSRIGRDDESRFLRVISDFAAVQKQPIRRLVLAAQCELDPKTRLNNLKLTYVCEEFWYTRVSEAHPKVCIPYEGHDAWRATSLEDGDLPRDILGSVITIIANGTKRGERDRWDLGRFAIFTQGPAWTRKLIEKSDPHLSRSSQGQM